MIEKYFQKKKLKMKSVKAFLFNTENQRICSYKNI